MIGSGTPRNARRMDRMTALAPWLDSQNWLPNLHRPIGRGRSTQPYNLHCWNLNAIGKDLFRYRRRLRGIHTVGRRRPARPNMLANFGRGRDLGGAVAGVSIGANGRPRTCVTAPKCVTPSPAATPNPPPCHTIVGLDSSLTGRLSNASILAIAPSIRARLTSSMALTLPVTSGACITRS